MKVTPVLPVALLLTLLATSPLHAQTTERITLYADKLGTDCSIADVGVRTVYVYMIHEGTGTRVLSEFRAPKPDCWTGAIWDSDELNGATIGGLAGYSQGSDLTAVYVGCLPLPVYIGRMVFEATGAAEPCCRYAVLPSVFEPSSVLTADCEFAQVPILGGSAVINENASCPCSPPLAFESTTWGRVKSLYH